MRSTRGPTCLDEPAVGADGRDIGRLGRLQARMDELVAWQHAEPIGSDPPAAGGSSGDAAADLLARADAICARNGLAPDLVAARRPAAERESRVSAAPGRAAD